MAAHRRARRAGRDSGGEGAGEAGEELGITAVFDRAWGEEPFFLTVTETTGAPRARHTDVSWWFALTGDVDQDLRPDEREFHGVRWWTPADVRDAGFAGIAPHLLRALDALDLTPRPHHSQVGRAARAASRLGPPW